MLPFIEKYKNSELGKNLITLGLGTVLAQIFPLLFYPVLSRQYSPEDFGLLATILSVVSVLAVVGSGKYESAIMIAKTKQDAANIATLSIGLSFISFFVFTIICIFFSDTFCYWMNEPKLKGWLFGCPLLAFFVIVYNTFNEWCVKNSMFLSLSKNKIYNSLFLTISKFSFGLTSVKFGLNYGEIIGRMFSAGGGIIRAMKVDKDTFRKVSLSECKRLSIEHIRFPKYTVPDQLLNTLAGVIPVFLIAAYFGQDALGQFAIMTSILSVPTVFIGQAVRDVFRQRAMKDFETYGNCQSIFNKFFKLLIIIALLGLIAVIFFLPSMFSIILGEQWRVAGKFAQIMAPCIAIGFVYNVLSVVWLIAGKNKYIMYWQAFFVFCFVSSYFIGIYYFNNINFCLIFCSVFVSCAYLINLYFASKFSKGLPNED